MEIYESLKDVLSPDQLNEFKEEVEKVIEERVKILADKKSDNYADIKIESMINELTDLADEFCEIEINKAREELIEEYDSKMQKFETNVVESLDHFLDTEISEKISDSLLENVAEREALLPLVDGIKKLLDEHYISVDTNGTRLIDQLEEEKESLELEVSKQLAEKVELSRLAEAAATRLLIREKTENLTLGNSKKVAMFFEGKGFDVVSEKIDDYIEVVSEDKIREPRRKRTTRIISEDLESGFDEKVLVTNNNQDRGFLTMVNDWMD